MEWRKNRLAVASVGFIVLLGITLWAVRGRDRSVESVAVPTVDLEKEAVTQIEVTRPNEDRVVLTKVDDEWRLTEPVEAEADNNAVESALKRLTDVKFTGIVATRPENHGRLEVDEAQAVHVVVKTGDEVAAELDVGKFTDGNTMVRVNGADEVLGLKGSARYVFDRALKSWRNRKVTNVPADDVQAIEFASKNGRFRFAREGDEWVPERGQRRIKEFDPKKVAGLVSTAARLTATDFAAPGTTVEQAGLASPSGEVRMVVVEQNGAPTDADGGVAEPTEPKPSETVVLEIGGSTDKEQELYLRRSGGETIYIVSKYLADRLRPDRKAFRKSKEPPPPALPPRAPQAQVPGSHPQITPEMMEQIQRQLQQQGN